jgi:hypothetical protein
MERDIHQAALRATAKVALSLTVIGCGARVDVLAGEPNGGAGGTGASSTSRTTVATATSQSAAASGAGGAAPVCKAPAPHEPVQIDPQAFACCAEMLPKQPKQAWDDPDPALLACCHTIVGQIDLNPKLVSQIDAKLVAPVWPDPQGPTCCGVLGNPCSNPCGCTVWGPPVPRAVVGMLLSLAQLEELEEVA